MCNLYKLKASARDIGPVFDALDASGGALEKDYVSPCRPGLEARRRRRQGSYERTGATDPTIAAGSQPSDLAISANSTTSKRRSPIS